MAMRLSYVKSDVARAKAAAAIAGGVIEANADNAAMHAAENRTTLIYNDWGDHRVGADILCYMNGYKDPRMEKMFLANDVGDYVGIRIGIDVTSKSQAVSKYSNMIVASDTPYLWFKVAFEVLGSVDPRNPDVALGHRAVVADRIGVGRGLDVSLGQIGVGAAGTALLERKPYGCFVE